MTVFQVALCDNLEAVTETHLMEVDLEAAVVTAVVLVVDVEVDEAEVREKKNTYISISLHYCINFEFCS